MNKMNAAVALKLLELCLIYGVPAVQTVLNNWNKDEITLEDVEAIGSLVKKPEEYFK